MNTNNAEGFKMMQNEKSIMSADNKAALDQQEKRTAENAFHESSHRHHALLSASPSAIYTCNTEGVITYYNQQAAALWGRSPALGGTDQLFCGSFKLFKPDGTYLPHNQTPMALTIKDGTSFSNQEVIMERPDGLRVNLLANIAPLRDAQGRILGAINSFIDITERKRLENAVESEHTLLNAIFDHIPVMLCVWGNDLADFKLNNQLTQLLGWTEADAADGNFIDKVYPDPVYRMQVIEYMKSLQGGWRDLKTTAKDGTVIDCSWANVVLTDGRRIGIGIDIRERKQAEEKLRESEERFRAMADGLPLIVWVHDLQGHHQFVNKKFYDFFGVSEQEVQSDLWPVLLHPDDADAYRADFFACVRSGRPFHAEARVRRGDGQWRWIDSWGQQRYSPSGEPLGFVGTSADITDRKQTEEKLRNLNESLEHLIANRTAEIQAQADRLRALANTLTKAEQTERKRLAKVLHDHIQQLIVGARMQVQAIRRDNDLERIHSTAADVNDILRETLDASRSLAIDLSPPVLHEAGLIGGLNWLVGCMRKKNQFTVNLTVDKNAEPVSEETRFLLFDCARELVLNAVKHSGVSAANVSLVREQNDDIKLIVSDQGKGFDPDTFKHRKLEEASFGLFSIQERLMHAGAKMEIDSSPGKGTTVTLTIPDYRSQAAAGNAPDSQGGQESGKWIKMHNKSEICRVLICDDHKIMRDGLTRMLQFEAGIEVVGQAADGPQAIEMASRLKPDVIIMDVSLGGMSGIEATRQILVSNPQIKIIGLSMHIDADVANAMHNAGAVGYLTKSGASEDLVAAIRCNCDLKYQ